jgi:hypothetical protein
VKIPRRRALEAAGWLIGLEAALAPTNALAQEGIAGFGAEASRIQAHYEARLLQTIEPDSIKRWARALGARPHVAGTAAGPSRPRG